MFQKSYFCPEAICPGRNRDVFGQANPNSTREALAAPQGNPAMTAQQQIAALTQQAVQYQRQAALLRQQQRQQQGWRVGR